MTGDRTTPATRHLISGGLGFIGSVLARRLTDDGDNHVHIVDDLSGTVTDWSDLRSKAVVDVADFRKVQPGLDSYDVIWHLASPVGSLGILGSTGRILEDIVSLAGHAHDVAAAAGARLVYVSSSEVYGRDGSHREDADAVVPNRHGARMEYAIGKLGAEHVLTNRALDSGVDVRMVRPFNCAGPGQSAELGFVVPTFVQAALEGQPLPVHGDGSARRAFVHVDDLVDGLLAVEQRGKPGELYNVGRPDEILEIRELAARIVTRLGSASTLEFIDARSRFGPHWVEAFDKVPDTTKVRAHTGWQARHDLDRIIDDVAERLDANQP